MQGRLPVGALAGAWVEGEALPQVSMLCAPQGPSLGATGAFGQSPFSQPPATPHQK